MLARDPWLVRTALGEIQGPFSEAELCDRLKSGHFTGEDELCRSGDYWFHLFERSEVVAKLGADVPVFYPRAVTPEDELTQTETETTAILQSDPAHDFIERKQDFKKAEGSEPRFSQNTLSLGKALAGIFLLMILIRLLLPILRQE